MIKATLTPATPKPESISWCEMILSKNVGKVYRINEERRDNYRFVPLSNGSALFFMLEDEEIVTVEHAENYVWEKYHFVLTGETITLTFK